MIVDWKTSKKKPSRSVLANRVQTLLYPLIFQQAGSGLFGLNNIPPTDIKLQYWYPLADDPEEIFPYSEAIHQETIQKISKLVNQIDESIQSGAHFPLTENREHCEFCDFRSLCDRSHKTSPIPPGADLESEDLSNTHFDLDLINEVEF